MDPWTVTEILLAIGFGIWVIFQFFSADGKRPGQKTLPGPWGLPLVGMMPFLGKKPFETVTKLGEKYGSLFQMKVGIKTVVVLNSEDVIRDAHGKDWAFADRPNIPSVQTILNSGGQSRFVLRPPNSTWKFLRKSATRGLGTFAASKSSHLQKVVEEAGEIFHEKIRKHLGHPYDPQPDVFQCVASVIGKINFGVDYQVDDPLLKDVLKLAETFAKFIQVGSIMDFFPFGGILMKTKINNFIKAIEPINTFTETKIRQHQCSTEVRDIADALWKTAQETPDAEKNALGLTDDHIRFISQDLFGAGFATTMETFRWSLNLIAAFPEKQAKLQAELDAVLEHRPPTLEHRDQLPYCEAVELEVFRISSLVPFSLPHSASQNTELRGYFIPRNALVLTNLYGHHYNPAHFPDPTNFRPERFVKEDGSLDLDLAQKVTPFGVGKRRCVGENLARQEIFLLIAQTFQTFRVTVARGVKIDPTAAEQGFTRRPIRYDLVFQERNK